MGSAVSTTEAESTSSEISAPIAATVQPSLPSSVIQLDCLVQWVTSCKDSSDYRSDASGRVVPAGLASVNGNVALPKPALFVALQSKTVDHLVVAPLNVASCTCSLLRCHCPSVDFQRRICGLHCYDQQLFIAQTEAVTVTDLSGLAIFRIPSYVLGTRKDISGICGNDSKLFIYGVSSIASFSKTTCQQETLIDLTLLPSIDASLDMVRLLAASRNKSALVIDKSRRKVHALCTGDRHLLGTYPNQLTGLDQFGWLWCVAKDTRGRIFASDGDNNTVYCLAPDGSVMQIFGGDDSNHNFLCPRGLAIAESADGLREHLVVVDWGHKRLVVFDL